MNECLLILLFSGLCYCYYATSCLPLICVNVSVISFYMFNLSFGWQHLVIAELLEKIAGNTAVYQMMGGICNSNSVENCYLIFDMLLKHSCSSFKVAL